MKELTALLLILTAARGQRICCTGASLSHTSIDNDGVRRNTWSVLIPTLWKSRSSQRSDGTELMPVSLGNEVVSMLALDRFTHF